LAFGPVAAFDSLLVTVGDGERSGIGEATFLPGYSDETADAGWTRALDLARRMAGGTLRDAASLAALAHRDAAFTATAFMTACEMLGGHPVLTLARPVSVPLLAIVNASAPSEFEPEIESHLAAGYRTLKVKVGFDLEADIARVDRIRALVTGRATLRLDGNQGYGRDEALRFVRSLDPEGIELLEQPCAAGDWDAAVDVTRISPVPMMLDESIFGIVDIERAAALDAARYIKLKLMKAGGLDALVAGLRRIRQLGMTPVLGNGVAGDVGCWMEACVAAREIDNAGEMNGFLKPRAGLFRDPVRVDAGAMILQPGGVPALDDAVLESLTVRHREFPGS
jgi:L-alanine-DL-glutamate epimerase-like enolase superfamily enzyme